jgi:hypothetical protein
MSDALANVGSKAGQPSALDGRGIKRTVGDGFALTSARWSPQRVARHFQCLALVAGSPRVVSVRSTASATARSKTGSRNAA